MKGALLCFVLHFTPAFALRLFFIEHGLLVRHFRNLNLRLPEDTPKSMADLATFEPHLSTFGILSFHRILQLRWQRLTKIMMFVTIHVSLPYNRTDRQLKFKIAWKLGWTPDILPWHFERTSQLDPHHHDQVAEAVNFVDFFRIKPNCYCRGVAWSNDSKANDYRLYHFCRPAFWSKYMTVLSSHC